MVTVNDIRFPAKITRWGNSCAVRLRKEFLRRAGLSEGDTVMVSYDANHDAIIIKKQAGVANHD